jgi:hypothetical protein
VALLAAGAGAPSSTMALLVPTEAVGAAGFTGDGNVSTFTGDGGSEAYIGGGGDDGSALLLRGRLTGLDGFLVFFFFFIIIISGTLGTAGRAALEGGAVADLRLGLLMSANCYRER